MLEFNVVGFIVKKNRSGTYFLRHCWQQQVSFPRLSLACDGLTKFNKNALHYCSFVVIISLYVNCTALHIPGLITIYVCMKIIWRTESLNCCVRMLGPWSQSNCNTVRCKQGTFFVKLFDRSLSIYPKACQGATK